MTKFYGTKNNHTDCTKFGGLVFPTDYNTEHRGKNNTHGSPIAARIMADRAFDNQCRKNIEILKLKEKTNNE